MDNAQLEEQIKELERFGAAMAKARDEYHAQMLAVSDAMAASLERKRPSQVTLNVNYPKSTDPLKDAQDWADLIGGGADV